MSIGKSKLEVFARFVEDLATLSKCTKRQVAAISINSTGTQVLSIGINGGPAGGIDCLCTLETKYSCIHAEAQCIAKTTSTTGDKIMLCTLSPCITCAALIINSGYQSFYYIEDWKDPAGLRILRDAGIYVGQLKGGMTDWK